MLHHASIEKLKKYYYLATSFYLFWLFLFHHLRFPPSAVIQTRSADHFRGQCLFGHLSSAWQEMVETLLAWSALKSSKRLRGALSRLIKEGKGWGTKGAAITYPLALDGCWCVEYVRNELLHYYIILYNTEGELKKNTVTVYRRENLQMR